jgi:hypothetical protein
MPVQHTDIEGQVVGPCADCGAVVKRRIECIDEFTHLIVDLCPACWAACQQRQVFATGCCG